MAKSAKLGQNFLHDKNIAAKIINEFLPQAGPVLEIGAGPGILSGMVLEKIPANMVTLVEIDPFLTQNLRQRFGCQLQIMEKNILEIDLAGMYPRDQVAIIGNLPYHISKDLIDWFITQRAKISLAVLMLQKDFVDKLLAAAERKKYNAQSIVFQLLFRTRRCFNVSAGSFTPRPRVMSTVLAVRPAESPLEDSADKFYDFVKLSFAERLKTLWNNLAAYYERAVLSTVFAATGISPQARAEQLPPGTFVNLFAALPADPVTTAK